MNKKYFFFDIDGTLTDRSTGKIVPSVQLALDKLQEAGHFVAIATGRAHYKARGFMESVGLHNMVCSGGGGLVVHDRLIQNEPLDLEKAKAIVKEAEGLGIGILLMLDDSIDCYSKNNLFREQVGERKEPTNYIIDPTLDYEKLKVIYKIYLSVSQEEERKLTLKDALGNLRFVKDYLMFQYDEKHQGILDILQQVHGKKEDVVVFGDDFNDMVMFDPIWTSIAMGNACDELKDKADIVAASNVDDGIYKLCEEQGWFEKIN
ncbi:HAD hydrolase family protein [Amedibacillus dolichus]|uniref:HAD hydrolase family protein n=1 Tax=Amedibacillus dolichus TaxID=31971 RepID=UPI0039A323EE